MSHLKAISFVVHDLDRSVRFFCEALGCIQLEYLEERGEEYELLYQMPGVHTKRAVLTLGKEHVELVQFLSHQGQEFPKDSHSVDLWFQHIAIVVSDMDQAYEQVMQHGVEAISHGPQTIPEWNEAAAGVKAFYFRSPEHHPLELIYFPKDKGKEEWHSQHALFLGIDHTAIAVSDTKSSLEFYQKSLELELVGESLNYGETQEKLTAIPNARVKITCLRDAEGLGVGVEFLHYIQGKEGRKSQHLSHDLSATKQVIECRHLDKILQHVPKKAILGKGPKEAMIMDPDGHYLLLRQMYRDD